VIYPSLIKNLQQQVKENYYMGYLTDLTDLTDLTSIANLKAQTEVASANSKGFVSSDVVNPNMAENY
jgi:hypothetical protein